MRILFIVLLCLPIWLFSQSQFDNVEISETVLTDQIYMLEGAGGNIGLIIGEEGALLIDDQYGPLAEKIKTKVAQLTDGPITYIANTHWHGDHSGGNEFFGTQGATIIAHKNVRKRMSMEHQRGDRVIPPSPEVALPVITFGEDMQLHFNGLEIMAIHVDNAHTDGDALLWIPGANVLHMGDCFFHQRYPFIDLTSGGSVDGAITAVETALFLIDDDTKIIPGHGPMAAKADLENYLTFLKSIRTRIKSYVSVGRGIDMIDAAKIVEGYEDWAWGFIDADRLVQIFHSSLTAGN